MAHFRLTDTGEAEFEEFGEVAEDVLFEKAYPILDEAVLGAPRDEQTGGLTPEGMEIVKAAVVKERERVKAKNVAEPDTELGREIKRSADAPTRLVDRIVHKVAGEKLGRFQGRGKPHWTRCCRINADADFRRLSPNRCGEQALFESTRRPAVLLAKLHGIALNWK